MIFRNRVIKHRRYASGVVWEKMGNAICYSTMSIQNDQIAPSIQQFDFAKLNSWIESWENVLSVGLLVQTKSWFLGQIKQ